MQIAKELRCVGVNRRWALVIDTSPRYSATVQMLRVHAPDDVEKQGAMFRGLIDAGVYSKYKKEIKQQWKK